MGNTDSCSKLCKTNRFLIFKKKCPCKGDLIVPQIVLEIQSAILAFLGLTLSVKELQQHNLFLDIHI